MSAIDVADGRGNRLATTAVISSSKLLRAYEPKKVCARVDQKYAKRSCIDFLVGKFARINCRGCASGNNPCLESLLVQLRSDSQSVVMEMTWRSPIRSQDLGILPLGTGLDHKLGRQFTAMAKFGAPQNCCRDA